MNTILQRYKEFTQFLLHLFNTLLARPDSIAGVIGRVILFIIAIFLALIILAFTGVLEDPLALMRF